MRYLAFALAVQGLWASGLLIAEKALRFRNAVDTCTYAPVNSSPGANIAGTSALVPWIIDSACNQYTFWTTIQEPIDVRWFDDDRYIAFVQRMWHYASTGYLKMHWSTNNGVTWRKYENINGDAGLYEGGGRYPDATLMDPALLDFPVVSWPELIAGPAWGYMCAATVDPYDPYGARSDNLEVQRCNSLMLPDGNVFLCGKDTSNTIFVVVYDPNKGVFLSFPKIIPTNMHFSGIDYDYTNDIIYIFGMNLNTAELEYFTLAWDHHNSRLTFSTAPKVLNLEPDPAYTVLWWDTWTLRDGTTPVCAVAAGDDPNANYPKVIYFTDGDTTVMLQTVNSPSTDTLRRLVPQLNLIEQVDGNYMTILWAQVTRWRTDTTYGWAYYDLYLSWSSDNGIRWSLPFNLTKTYAESECLPQAPQHQKGCVLWLGWAREPTDETDLYWDLITEQDPPLHGLPCYLYLSAICGVGVDEGAPGTEPFSYRMIGKTLVLSGLPANAIARARVYDVAGRETRSGEGAGELRLDMSGLPAGIYPFTVRAEGFVGAGKVVLTR